MSAAVRVTVTYRNGDHITNTIRGMRASSTSGYVDAAEKLGRKLFPDQELVISWVPEPTAPAVCLFDIKPDDGLAGTKRIA
ncbi:hypothetical protein ACFJGW_00730 [Burkholderiaceae bacterium UC74_6]